MSNDIRHNRPPNVLYSDYFTSVYFRVAIPVVGNAQINRTKNKHKKLYIFILYMQVKLSIKCDIYRGWEMLMDA